MFSGDSGMAAWTSEGIGRMTPSGIKWRGAIFLTAGSIRQLELLFLKEIDPEGDFS